MKITDIKGSTGKRIMLWVMRYINNLVFDEIRMVAPFISFDDRISIQRMEDFKKLISGIRVGYPTHGCKDGEEPWRSDGMSRPVSRYYKGMETPNACILDIQDHGGLFNIEVDLEGHHDDRYWVVVWSIKANKDNLMAKLDDMFGKDIEQVKNHIHTDIVGTELKVGDIICYSDTYGNSVHIGTINKLGDYTMVVNGRTVGYDGVLVVNNEIELKDNKYVHKA